MSEHTATEADVAKLREWVDDLRIPKPVEAPVAPSTGNPDPKVNVLKAPYEPTEGARRVQKIIESMDLKRQERTRLLAQGNSKRVQFQAETNHEKRTAEAQIAAWKKDLEERIEKLVADYDAKSRGRQWELDTIAQAVEKLDLTLANFRKQLDAELVKLDPERAVKG